MAYGKISKRQQEILDYLKYSILNRGFPPSVREICDAVNLKSTSSVHSHLEALEKNGYIRRDSTKTRAIEIVDDNFNLTRREMINIPLVGTVAAGQPLLAVENIETYFPIPMEHLPNSQVFMLKVKGESMVNAGILDGDMVLVSRTVKDVPGDVGAQKFWLSNRRYEDWRINQPELPGENEYLQDVKNVLVTIETVANNTTEQAE